MMRKTELQYILKTKFNYLGEIFPYKELNGDVFDLYGLAIEYAELALSPAFANNGVSKDKYNYIVEFIEGKGINAFTCDEADGSIIAINSSVPILLFAACVKFSFYCNITTSLPIEDNGKLVLENLDYLEKRLSERADLGNITEFFNKFVQSEAFKKSKDKISYALFLYDIAIRFLVMHEVMHITLGHTCSLKKKYGLDIFLEFSDEETSNINIELIQTLEFISDRHTIRGVLVQMLNGNTQNSLYDEIMHICQINPDCYIYRAVTIATTILFHLFPNKSTSINENFTNSHPHPYVRMQWLITELSYELKDEDLFVEYLVKPFGLSLGIFDNNFGKNFSWIKFANEDIPNFDNKLVSQIFYQNVIARAKKVQHDFWKNSPIYEGDGRNF